MKSPPYEYVAAADTFCTLRVDKTFTILRKMKRKQYCELFSFYVNKYPEKRNAFLIFDCYFAKGFFLTVFLNIKISAAKLIRYTDKIVDKSSTDIWIDTPTNK